MDERISKIIDDVIAVEKGYVNDPADSGGETNWGITLKVAREAGYHGEMRAMPKALAKTIYYHTFVVAPGFDQVLPLSAEIAAELVEFGVNCGPGRAATCLQEALNDLNDQGQLWPDIKEDGAIGPKTLSCLKIYLLARKAAGIIVMLRDLNSRQHHHYSQLVRRRPKDERFFYGWVLNRVVY